MSRWIIGGLIGIVAIDLAYVAFMYWYNGDSYRSTHERE
jgi:hypothetical protein